MTGNKHDISSKQDIKLLVDSFYKKIIPDPNMGFIFTDVAKISWDVHIINMYSFWNTVLLGEDSYKGNPMIKHLELNDKVPLTNEHFNRWLQLWEETINENFNGEKANEAVIRAKNIAAAVESKIALRKKDN